MQVLICPHPLASGTAWAWSKLDACLHQGVMERGNNVQTRESRDIAGVRLVSALFSLFIPISTLGSSMGANLKSHNFHIKGHTNGMGMVKTGCMLA